LRSFEGTVWTPFVAKKNRNSKQLVRFSQALRPSANRYNTLSLSGCFHKRYLLASFFFFFFFKMLIEQLKLLRKDNELARNSVNGYEQKIFHYCKGTTAEWEMTLTQNSSLSAR